MCLEVDMAEWSLLVCPLHFHHRDFDFAVVYYNTDIYGVEFNSCCIFLEWGADLMSVWSLVL